MFDSVLSASILGRAREQGLLDVQCIDIRPFSDRKHKNTDDYPFGGGAGMVMMAQPILAAMASVTGEGFHGRRIYLGPRGNRLTTAKARELAREEELVLLCGHYEGVDQRALDACIDEEISIGDNDTLSAMVAASIRADLLILLSDIDGLYDSDPHKNPDARLIPVVERLEKQWAGKLLVAKLDIDEAPALAERYGIDTIPTLLVFQGGKAGEPLVNPGSMAQIEAWLAEGGVE